MLKPSCFDTNENKAELMGSNTLWTFRTRFEPKKSDFTRREWEIIQKHKTPESVQTFLRSIRYNRETSGATCYSFRRVLRENRAHCLEGALVAAVILEQHGYPPVVVSIESQDKLDHVLFLFKRGGPFCFFGLPPGRYRCAPTHPPLSLICLSLSLFFFTPHTASSPPAPHPPP